jgi:hypothetical protein
MNTIKLRKELITRISEIEDMDFLNAIKTILDYKNKEKFIHLTNENEEERIRASEEGKSGQFILQSEMDKKAEKWLREV